MAPASFQPPFELQVRSIEDPELNDLSAHFTEHCHAIVRRVLPPHTVARYRRYITMQIAAGSYSFGDARAQRWRRYRDPVSEALLVRAARPLSTVVGRTLIPTYSFTVMYPPGADLPAHTDRAACEFSASLTIGNRREGAESDSWPIHLVPPTRADPLAVILDAGDLVVYRGGEVAHSRESQPEGCHNYSVLLHYVDADGPFAEYAFDADPDAPT